MLVAFLIYNHLVEPEDHPTVVRQVLQAFQMQATMRRIEDKFTEVAESNAHVLRIVEHATKRLQVVDQAALNSD